MPPHRKRADALRRGCEPDSEASLGAGSSVRMSKRKSPPQGELFRFGTRNRNRTCNYPLGGGYYIHLTMQACYLIVIFARVYKGCTKLRLAGLGHKILVVFESIPIVFRSIFSNIPPLRRGVIIFRNRRIVACYYSITTRGALQGDGRRNCE